MGQAYPYKEPPPRMSASTISSFSDCEEQFAFDRLYQGIPTLPEPHYLVFGNVIHTFNQRIWAREADAESLWRLKKYAMQFLADVFAGKHGPQGESENPVSMRWLTTRQMEKLTDADIKDKIKEAQGRYAGIASLALDALILGRLAPYHYVRTEAEFDIAKHDVVIKDNHASLKIQLSGRMDRIHFFADRSYDIVDVKTGKARQTYKRNKLVRDIQMTVYQLAGYRTFDQNPKHMYLEALGEVTKDIIARAKEDVAHGRIPEALNEIRIPVEIREEVHFTNLARIAADVRSVMRMVIHPEEFQRWEFEKWEPLSDWGKLASFTENIRERRFIPRIGSWCRDCPFLELCREKNTADWERYHKSRSTDSALPARNTPEIRPAPEPEPQSTLFAGAPLKQRSFGKMDREIRREMTATGEFIRPQSIRTLVEKVHQLIPRIRGELCTCRRLKLIPLTILEHLGEYRHGKISLPTLLAKCPYKECPHKNISSY